MTVEPLSELATATSASLNAPPLEIAATKALSDTVVEVKLEEATRGPSSAVIQTTDTFSTTIKPDRSSFHSRTTLATRLVAQVPEHRNGISHSKLAGVAVVVTIVGLVTVMGVAFYLWRRITGLRMTKLAPGQQIVGPNEASLIKAGTWS
jgi:hypothetical protein